MDEFAEACELLKKHLPEHDTKEQLLEMCKMMDINKDGLVDLNEFLETFRLCEQAKGNLNNYGGGSMNAQTNGHMANGNDSGGGNSSGRGPVKKQSTDEDEDETVLDCDDTPKKMENGQV